MNEEAKVILKSITDDVVELIATERKFKGLVKGLKSKEKQLFAALKMDEASPDEPTAVKEMDFDEFIAWLMKR